MTSADDFCNPEPEQSCELCVVNWNQIWKRMFIHTAAWCLQGSFRVAGTIFFVPACKSKGEKHQHPEARADMKPAAGGFIKWTAKQRKGGLI